MGPCGGHRHDVALIKDAYEIAEAAMLDLREDKHLLTDFKRNTSAFVSQMKLTHRPVVLT